MTLEEFIDDINKKGYRTAYIVQVKYKYPFDKEYRILNKILIWDQMCSDWYWDEDWIDAQTDVKVCNYVALEEVFDDYM